MENNVKLLLDFSDEDRYGEKYNIEPILSTDLVEDVTQNNNYSMNIKTFLRMLFSRKAYKPYLVYQQIHTDNDGRCASINVLIRKVYAIDQNEALKLFYNQTKNVFQNYVGKLDPIVFPINNLNTIYPSFQNIKEKNLG